MSMKRMIAALLALCLLVFGCAGAVAEEGDVVGDLLNYFLGGTENEAVEEAPQQDLSDDESADGEASANFGEGDQAYADIPGNLVQVDDLAVVPDLSDDWLNLLLLGTDARGDTKHLRTDTMVVLSVNSKTREVKLTSIMRDIYVELPEAGWQRLNAACVYGGPELTMRTINQYFDLNIQRYALVNMRCLVNLVDALGGIRLDVTEAEASAMRKLSQEDAKSTDGGRAYTIDPVSAGSQVLLNGKQVLSFCRIRKSDSDYERTSRQRTVLVTIAKRLQQENVFSLGGIVTNMLQYVETNMTFEQIMTIVGVCAGMDLNQLTEMRIPADGTFEAGTFGSTWLIKPDFEENKRLLHEFIYGN